MGNPSSSEERDAPGMPQGSALLDPRNLIQAALGANADDMAQIDSIVKELEETPNPLKHHELQQRSNEAKNKLQMLQHLAENGNKAAVAFLAQNQALVKRVNQAALSSRQQDQADAQAQRTAAVAADKWLRSEVARGAKDAAVAQKAKVAQHTAEEEQASKEEVRRTALAELEAREALRQHATEAAEIRLEDAKLAAQRARLKLEGLSGLHVPQKPRDETNDQFEPPPEAPQMPKAVKKAADGPLPEFYAVLEIELDATFEEIRKAYRREALKWHPDKNRGRETEAANRFQKISEAFDTLYDPQKRERYDSGQLPLMKAKAKKLQGHGWASAADEDESLLTSTGLRYKSRGWAAYVFYGGRLDDDENDLVMDESDPRCPQQKVKVFWRHLAEKAHAAKQNWDKEGDWMMDFVATVWKDTPSRWPKAAELKNMNEAPQQEWRERRMVYNRRKAKLHVHLKMHLDYLAIPGRVKKEQDRLKRLGLGIPPFFK